MGREDEDRLVAQMVDLACEYGRYGYRRMTASLRWEGWILGWLQNRAFFSLAALNVAIGECLGALNQRPLPQMGATRRELFERLDRPALQLLPAEGYELAAWKICRANIDYQIEVDRRRLQHPAPVAWQATGSPLYGHPLGGLLQEPAGGISSPALRSPTLDPSRTYAGFSSGPPSLLIRWARQTSPATGALVQEILQRRPHPEQGYRACLPLDYKVSQIHDSLGTLQDIVNEMAHRLGFNLEHGRYRGTRNEIGHDGIWTGPDGHSIVVEVKTTDAYRLPIETVANYRRDLIKKNRITEENSSILVVVGREETGELEAQIRGSRHAWDVRLISIDALVRLMKIRQEVDDPNTESRIRSLLVPREYTRVDEIIDLVFSTAEDLLEETPPNAEDEEANLRQAEARKDKPVSFNSACAARISKHLSADLTKQSRIIFADADRSLTVTCAVSKEYDDPKGAGYWFAFHPHQLEKLRQAKTGYAAFGCGSPDQIALLRSPF